MVDRILFHIRLTGEKFLGHCVCSFSESGDILSQWRAYASDGAGISVGFNSRLLSQDALSSGFTVGRCIYDREVQSKMCSQFLMWALEGIDLHSLAEDFPDKLQDPIDNFVFTIGLYLKHPAFVDEREWRLVSGPNHLYSDQWNYRAAARGLSSYVILPLPSIFRRESKEEEGETTPHLKFVMGPKARKTPTSQILQALSYQVLGRGYGVSQSGVPYIE